MQKKTKADRADLDDFIEKTEAIHEAKAQLTAKTERRNEITTRQESLTQERLPAPMASHAAPAFCKDSRRSGYLARLGHGSAFVVFRRIVASCVVRALVIAP